MGEILPVWREALRVRAYETGRDGRAALPGICDWLQEAAGNHARHLGWSIDTLQSGGLTWVLARLHVEIARLPVWREEVTVETWPAGASRAFAVREFRVVDGAGAVAVAATSGWLLLDLAARRPVRPPEAIAALGGRTPGRVIDDPFPRVPEAAAGAPPRACEVRFADLDMNGHANNVALIRMLLEALPADVAVAGRPVSLEVEFRAEALAGEQLAAHGEAHGGVPPVFAHRLVRAADGREIARARSVWATPE